MALKGNLRDFSLPQLLNLINLAQKTGTLVVEGPSDVISVCFREGKLAYARDGIEDDSLISLLLRQDKINASQHRSLMERMGQMNEKELGLALLNANYLDQAEIILSLQTHFTDILNQLFTWAEGFFWFESDRLPPEEKITVRVSLENIILNGTRRLQEEEMLQDEIPNLDMALRLIIGREAYLRELKLSHQERKVISCIDPKNTLRQIAGLNRMSDLEIRRVVYRLLQAGVVEMVRPAGMRSPFPSLIRSSTDSASDPAQKSLINRLISRIRAI